MNDTATGTAQRPTLLTVICILSALAGLWGLYDGYKSAFTEAPERNLAKSITDIDEQRAQMGENAGLMESIWNSTIELAQNSVTYKKQLGYSGLALSLLGLVAVWMMWNLRKSGFWLYLLTTIASFVTTFIWLGTSLVALLAMGFIGLISIVFVILYAVNLKHMH